MSIIFSRTNRILLSYLVFFFLIFGSFIFNTKMMFSLILYIFHLFFQVLKGTFFYVFIVNSGFRDCVHKSFFVLFFIPINLCTCSGLGSRIPWHSYSFSNFYCCRSHHTWYRVPGIRYLWSRQVAVDSQLLFIWNADFIVYSPQSTFAW